MEPAPEPRPDSAAVPSSAGGDREAPEDAQRAPCALDTVAAGHVATITRMENADHPMIARVKAIGLFPGSRVRVLRQGERLVLSGERVRIALSRAICSHIQVCVDGSAEVRS